MTQPVTLSTAGSIAVIEINNPPVNALSQAVRQGLLDAVVQADADAAVTAIVILGAGRSFPAGADIKEFGQPMQDPHLPDVIDRIESCSKPVVAALHGTALGGGFEIALGSHYRIAVPSARVGLPEIHLGLIPGAGGTQRLPRLCGAAMALDIMFKGTPISAQDALAAGLIDRLAEGDLRQAALIYAAELQTPRRSITQPFADGRLFERDCFFECLASEQSKGMIHAFFAQRASAKVPEASRAEPRPLNRLGVVGGGTMGAGITVAALNSGLPVTMIERDHDSLARGRANVEQVYDRLIAKGRMSEAQKSDIMARYQGSTQFADLSEVDMVIEAVFERLDVKRAVFEQLDKVLKPDAVLASNTSYIDIDEISSVTNRRKHVLGLHFFSPANIMKLLEIVVPQSAADDVVATGFALAKILGKIPVRAGNSPGFIGNRILGKYGDCAAHMMEDGATPYEIDAAIVEFGYPMGLHAMYDLAGLDIGWDNRKAAQGKRNPAERYVEIADRICERGWFGQKTGRGFYLYPDGARIGAPDPEILALIEAERAKKSITARRFTAEEIMARYLAAMVNEACEVLREGVALKPSDIDVTFVHGYGFPRYRGGPMKFADSYGLARMLDDIRRYGQHDPIFWQASPLLVELVASGQTFNDLNKG